MQELQKLLDAHDIAFNTVDQRIMCYSLTTKMGSINEVCVDVSVGV